MRDLGPINAGVPPRRAGSWLIVVLLLATVVSLALHETGQLKPLEDLAMIVIGPLQRATSGLTGSGAELFQTFRDARELRAANQLLREANDALTSENIRLREIEAENTALRELLQFKRNAPTYQMLAGEVVGRDPNSLLRYIIISVGELDGVRPGMPVVAGGSRLVGRVADVLPRASKVQLINDAASAVNALVESSRAAGLIQGQADGSLRMDYIHMGDEVIPGDIILTSGLGGNFPRALVIGQVTEVEKRDIDLFQSAKVRPAANLDQLEIVLVITNFESMVVP
ncbi:MAG: rod shape-determining protein MreC [Thermoflexales bacterium]|nr:rod shape-determining protein MreC [Thermoflexales bacterium]